MTRIALAVVLAAWWWALGVVFGCLANAWMHRLTGGAWGAPVRAAALSLARRVPWLLLGLVFAAVAMKVLYPWTDLDWAKTVARPAFVQAWLSPVFFIARLVVYGVAWLWLARPASLESKGRAAASLVVYAITMTLASVDLVMSLMPGWYSTVFGMIVMSTQALSGAAAVALLAIARRPDEWPAASKVPVSRDIGNLMLTWCMSWGYLAFMQFIVIWAENLPREIQWFVPRMQTGWKWLGLALVLTQLVIPFVALLFRGVKDNPRRLSWVDVLVLASTAHDAAWIELTSLARSGHA